jgi:hypothetical protein
VSGRAQNGNVGKRRSVEWFTDMQADRERETMMRLFLREAGRADTRRH